MNFARLQYYFNQWSINKITSRIRCTSTQDISWVNPHGEEKPNKPFPYIRVSSNDVNDDPWHASGKTSEGEGYVPRAIAQEPNQEQSLSKLHNNQKQKCTIEKRDITKYKCMNEWMPNEEWLTPYIYKYNHEALNRAYHKYHIIIIRYNKIFNKKT